MEVEAFTTEELTADHGEVDSVEAVRGLVTQLALHGQEKFFNTAVSSKPFPYRKMTEQERVVYTATCPVHTALENYGEGVIPLRILQIAAVAKELGFFTCLEVWHPQNGDMSDPVLVGEHVFRRDGQGWDTTERYILARWGTVLKPFKELIEEARVKYEAELMLRLAEIKEKVEARLRVVSSVVQNYVLGNGGSVTPNFYD